MVSGSRGFNLPKVWVGGCALHFLVCTSAVNKTACSVYHMIIKVDTWGGGMVLSKGG